MRQNRTIMARIRKAEQAAHRHRMANLRYERTVLRRSLHLTNRCLGVVRQLDGARDALLRLSAAADRAFPTPEIEYLRGNVRWLLAVTEGLPTLKVRPGP